MTSIPHNTAPAKTNAELLHDRLGKFSKDFQGDLRALIEGKLTPEVARQQLTERSGEMGAITAATLALIDEVSDGPPAGLDV